MIGWRVCHVVERLASDSDYVLLANFERVRGFTLKGNFCVVQPNTVSRMFATPLLANSPYWRRPVLLVKALLASKSD
jgi:hypothetical protein